MFYNSFCTLAIAKQPFPKPIKHNTRAQNVDIEEPVIVQLISAPKASYKAEGKVKAQIVYEEFQSKSRDVLVYIV